MYKMYMLQSALFFGLFVSCFFAPPYMEKLFMGEDAFEKETDRDVSHFLTQLIGMSCFMASGILCTVAKYNTVAMNNAAAAGFALLSCYALFLHFGGRGASAGFTANFLGWGAFDAAIGVYFFVGKTAPAHAKED
eukprot:m.457432 g.457432  ORF g.457432 m.457432 type:complete len:135 (+) comp21251_c0_seq1:208-612(+)